MSNPLLVVLLLSACCATTTTKQQQPHSDPIQSTFACCSQPVFDSTRLLHYAIGFYTASSKALLYVSLFNCVSFLKFKPCFNMNKNKEEPDKKEFSSALRRGVAWRVHALFCLFIYLFVCSFLALAAASFRRELLRYS